MPAPLQLGCNQCGPLRLVGQDSEGVGKVGAPPKPKGVDVFIWILLSVIYLMCLITLGMTTLRKGHTVLFWIGIVFPLLWIIGAVSAPTSQVSADMARSGLQ
jgi:hypothetical protein